MDQQTSDFVQSIIAGQVRHACTYIAGALVTYGVIAPDQNASTITVLTGIGVGAVGQIWSIAQKKGLSGIKADLELWKKRALAPAAKTAAALAAFLLVMPASGQAADVNKPAVNPYLVKAPLLSQPYSGSGFYAGLEGGMAAGSANTSGLPGNPTLTMTQGLAGGIVGWSSDMANGSRYWFCEADVGWNNFNGSAAGFSLTGPVTSQILCGAGAPASQILTVLPTFGLTPPTLPNIPGATTSNPHLYFAGGVDLSDISAQFGGAKNTDWAGAPLVTIGIDSQLSTGGVIGARLENVFQSQDRCIAGTCGHLNDFVRAKVLYKF